MVRARGDRDLVLARQVRVVGVAVEELGQLVDDGLGVKELIGVEAGDRAARDVADSVAAPAGGGEAGGVEPVEDRGQRAELEPVQLDVLPRGELTVAAPNSFEISPIARSPSGETRPPAP